MIIYRHSLRLSTTRMHNVNQEIAHVYCVWLNTVYMIASVCSAGKGSTPPVNLAAVNEKGERNPTEEQDDTTLV